MEVPSLIALLFWLLGGGGGDAIPQWDEAARMAEENRTAWSEVFASLDVNSLECEAIVFPELLRYSRLRDGVEQAALLGLYVRGGARAANFSVGMFQMKPSFAEEVERAWMRSPLRHRYELYFDVRDTAQVRRLRVQRLTDTRWQCVYLAVFVRLMLERDPSIEAMPPGDRVRILATAYNSGFTLPLAELLQRQSQKSFHLDFVRFKNTVCYSYADLSARRLGELLSTDP